MILKVTVAQPIFDNYKRGTQRTKEELKKKRPTSFASILEETINSQSTSLLTSRGVNLFL